MKRGTLRIALASGLLLVLAATGGSAQSWSRMNNEKDEQLAWFNEAKFGMLIHWGLYSIPGGEWKGREAAKQSEWLMFRGEIPRAEYATLARKFNPKSFNPRAWCQLAKDAGMRYLVVTAKHYDGFAMFDSKASGYNVVAATPYKADVVGQLHDAAQQVGIPFGVFYSHALDWYDGGDGGFADSRQREKSAFGVNQWDPSPQSFDDYIEKKAKPQVQELLDQYRDLAVFWFDFPKYLSKSLSLDFYRMVYETQPKALVSNRVGNGLGDFDTPGDNMIPLEVPRGRKQWETPGTMNGSWGYHQHDENWKSTKELLFWLVSIASKGGNYLLNVGPDGDGLIPEASITRLKEMGEWMRVNGNAIYGTSAWQVDHEGPCDLQIKGNYFEYTFPESFSAEDIWFTAKGDHVYAIGLEWPANRKVLVKEMANLRRETVLLVSLLGSEAQLTWSATPEGLSVTLPETAPSKYGYVLDCVLGNP